MTSVDFAGQLRTLGVRLTDDSLLYRGITHRLSEIRNVSYVATRTEQTVNSVPTGVSFAARCRLYMGNGRHLTVASPQGWWKHGGRDAISPIWLFSEIISELTFDQRLQYYSSGFERLGFLQVGEYQLHRSGRVYKRARLKGTLRSVSGPNISLMAFVLRLSTGVGPVQIPLDTDRDCILYLLKHRFGLSFKGERLREPQVLRRRRLFENVVFLAAKISKSDGVVSAEEIREFKAYFRTEEFPLDDVGRIFKQAVTDQRSIADAAADLADACDDTSLLEHILIGLIRIAWIDEKLGEGERKALADVAEGFGIGADELEHFISLLSSRAGSGHRDQPRSGAQTWDVIAVEHLKVLGLGPGATKAQIRAAYLNLTPKFHPDLLRSKGLPDELIVVAEETLKKINASYAWLKQNKYG
jgi:DnaJ like chaperone protein